VLILVAVSWLYFYQDPFVLATELTKNFVPTVTDFVIAIGLGMSLNYFWDHITRINIIVMIAGMASLLPACIMAGYWASYADWDNMTSSLLLCAEYAVGIFIGSEIIHWRKNT
jgi:predicted membrane-bound spermidine synthase